MEHEAVGRRIAVMVWLLWMAVMFQFSTQLWNSMNTKAVLEVLLSAPLLPDLTASFDLLNFGIRKTAHFTEYAVLALVGCRAIAIGWQQTRRQSLRLALVGAILFAIADEWHQRFVPSRTSTPQDVFIDIAGASVVVVTMALWRADTVPQDDIKCDR